MQKPAIEDFDLAGTDESSSDAADAVSGGARIVGAVALPNSTTTGAFGTARRPVAYTFETGRLGANNVKIAVEAQTGDSVLTVYGPLRTTWAAARKVAENDDAPGGGVGSELTLNLSQSSKYLIVVREYFKQPGAFILTVGNPATPNCGLPLACGTARAQPRPVRCGDGSFVYPVTSCALEGNVCAWKVSSPACPLPAEIDCSSAGACGPERQYEPQTCIDGTLVYGSATCERDGDVCKWKSVIPECPVVTCTRTTPCPGSDTYCQFPPGFGAVAQFTCGNNYALGTCQRKPSACAADEAGMSTPVCGCDGQTYATKCLLERAGVSIRQFGPC